MTRTICQRYAFSEAIPILYRNGEAGEVRTNEESSPSTGADASGDARDDYRSSHATTGAVTDYIRTYEVGYYAALWEKIEKPLVQATLRELGGPQKKCLDFACGTGRITTVAADHFAEVVGVDVSALMLASAHMRTTSDCSRST